MFVLILAVVGCSTYPIGAPWRFPRSCLCLCLASTCSAPCDVTVHCILSCPFYLRVLASFTPPTSVEVVLEDTSPLVQRALWRCGNQFHLSIKSPASNRSIGNWFGGFGCWYASEGKVVEGVADVGEVSVVDRTENLFIGLSQFPCTSRTSSIAKCHLEEKKRCKKGSKRGLLDTYSDNIQIAYHRFG